MNDSLITKARELAMVFLKDPYKAGNPEIHFSGEEIAAIVKADKEGEERMTHIMSIGGRWTDDDYLLVLGYRANVEIVNQYFAFFELQHVDLTDLDDLIRSSVKDKTNHAYALESANKVYKNLKKVNDVTTMRAMFQQLHIKVNW